MFENLIGESPKFVALLRTATKLAAMDLPVLITGEPGTGKAALARALHSHSARAARPFVAVDCAASPEELAGSGSTITVDGALDGLAAMEGGTLFLGRVDALTPASQARLLGFLETGVAQSESGAARVDVRIVAATSSNLLEAVRRGEFRRELFYRLGALPLEVPPLRERPEDVPLLLDHYLEHFAREHGIPIASLSGTARERLVEYAWPGNIRELRAICEQLAALSAGRTVEACELPVETLGLPPDEKCLFGVEGLDIDLEQVEIELIRRALVHTNYVHERAARLLGITRGTLAARMEKFGITGEDGHS